MYSTKLVHIAQEALILVEIHLGFKQVAYRYGPWKPPTDADQCEFCSDPSRRMTCAVWTRGDDLLLAVHYTQTAYGGWQEAGVTMYGVNMTLPIDEFRDRVLTPAVLMLLDRIP